MKEVRIETITNAIDAEFYTREMCLITNGNHIPEWCRSFFAQNFPRLTQCEAGRILMGLKPPYPENMRPYHYTPQPF